MKEWSPNPAGTSKEMLAGLTQNGNGEECSPEDFVVFLHEHVEGRTLWKQETSRWPYH